MLSLSKILEKKLFEFPVDRFIAQSAQNLAEEINNQGYTGIVVGAGGGIDSLVTTALCLKAIKKRDKGKVVAFQINDSRIKGEHYNPEIYRSLGADFKQSTITSTAMDMEKSLAMPPRRLTMALMKLVLRWTPIRMRRSIIGSVISGNVPRWIYIHYQLLILLHRLRVDRLTKYAARNGLMLVICSNLTESSLGYFVERGIDDPRMGNYAPLAPLYKSQVMHMAQYMGFSEQVLHQRPSPGFGGIYDEEIIGPYELVDLILIGLSLGYSDEELTHAIRPRVFTLKKQVPFMGKDPYGLHYVRFIRRLASLHDQKNDMIV
jgi:NAD+ synthase